MMPHMALVMPGPCAGVGCCWHSLTIPACFLIPNSEKIVKVQSRTETQLLQSVSVRQTLLAAHSGKWYRFWPSRRF